jgi:hypothetical protein
MIRKFLFIITAFILLLTSISVAQESQTREHNTFVFSRFFIESLPGGDFYPAYFENYFPDTTFLIEESNGFSYLDPPRAYFEGDSFVHFNWYYDGFCINSALDSGSPAFVLPFGSIQEYQLTGEVPFRKVYGFNILPARQGQTFSRMKISSVYSDLGGFIPGAENMVNPHATSEEGRNLLLYTGRRKIISNVLMDFVYSKELNDSTLSLGFSYFDLARRFNDFNERDTMFDENGKRILLHSKFEKKIKGGFFGISAAFNSLSREKNYAELGRLPQETGENEKNSIFAGFRLKNGNLELSLSYIYEKKDIFPAQTNFLKDIKDNDGEGFFPFGRWGAFSSNVFRLTIDLPLSFSLSGEEMQVDLFADFKAASLTGDETPHEFNPISFDRSPYLVVLWEEGAAYRNRNDHGRAGAIFKTSVSPNLELFAKVLLQYSSLGFELSENNWRKLALGYDVGVLLFKNKNPEILISFERMPYEFREDVNFFLEKQSPWGAIYHWTDRELDLQFQSGEEGQLFGYTGGRYHSIDSDLRVPIKNRLLVDMYMRLSQKFSFQVKGIYKKITNSLWVEHQEDYGFYETIGGRELYFYSQPFQDYVLTNYRFDDDPFYFQLLLHFLGQEEKKWFFSFSFMAHIGMGYTSFANGAGANDIGILDEYQANPNSWINGYGRVDGDRAYVGKMYFGFYIMKNLFFAANLKYRDGTPFAFIDNVQAYEQRILYLQTIQAENWKGIKGGPRKDYLSDVSIKIRYFFKLFNSDAEIHLTLFNLLDFGSELSEYVFSGGSRYAMELQIPRSLRLGLQIKL